MILRIFFILILLMFLSDIYLYNFFIRPYKKYIWLRKIYWLPTALLTLFLLFFLIGDVLHPTLIQYFGIYVIIYLTIVIPKSLFALCGILGDACRCVVRLCGFPRVGNALWSLFVILGLAGGLTGMFIILYGNIWGWRRYEIKEVTFSHSQVPQAFDGYRIVQISDLHLGTIASHPHEIERMVGIINDLHPDLIAFTGDLVNLDASELDAFIEYLSALKSEDGVFSVLGNHDYGTYRRWPDKKFEIENLETLKEGQRDMGWMLLLNENKIIKKGTDSIAIVGVENDGAPPFPSLGDLPKATLGTEGMFKVLLSHDPTHWRRKVLPNTDIQLMLAGHTHAMQFMIAGHSPSAWLFPEWAGMYKEGDRGLYVNIGLGSSGIFPYRFGAWPEISVITLRRK